MKRKTLFGLAAGASALFCSVPAQAQEYYVGQILLVPYNFCPLGSADAAGQLMSISQNEVLFTLYGTTYGGNGQTTFGLPDLRGRAPLHVGQGPGLRNYILGQAAGTESVTMTVTQMPAHNHVGFARAAAVAPDTDDPPGAAPADFVAGFNVYVNNTPPNVSMAAGTAVLAPAGGSQPFQNLRPYLAMRYCVILEGIFPSQG